MLCDTQVGMPGSVPDQLRQDIIAPLQDLPRILQVCFAASDNAQSDNRIWVPLRLCILAWCLLKQCM